MDFLFDPNIWIAFAMLTTLEIVLGIDNIIFISILVGRLPHHMRDKARRLGLGFAMVSRLALLASLSWVMGLTANLFSVLGQDISGRDLVLLVAASSCSTRHRTKFLWKWKRVKKTARRLPSAPKARPWPRPTPNCSGAPLPRSA